MREIIVVTPLQIMAARAAIAIAGGPDKVHPMTVKIAEAKPRRPHDSSASSS